MNYTIYSIATGQIEKTISCAESDIAAQFSPEIQAVCGGAFPDDKFYVEGGTPVAIPPSPSPAHVFNYTTKQWEDPRTLQDLKDQAWTRIKQARTNAIDAPLVTPYGTFDSGPKDRTNITDAVLLLQTLAAAGTPTTIDFTLADNTTVTLTTSEMVSVGLLLGQKVQAAHANARVKRAEIQAANTPAEVDAVVW